MTGKQRKWLIVLMIIILVIIVIRILLPELIRAYANKTLRDLKGYTGHIKDVDLYLLRGVYALDSLTIINTGEDSLPVAFVEIPRIEVEVDWKALFKGVIVSTVIIDNPQLNFAVGYDEKAKARIEQYGPDTIDWPQMIRDLIPIRIDHFEVINGKISYIDFTTKPQIHLGLSDLNIIAENLSNFNRSDSSLPSGISMNAISTGGGKINIKSRVNLLKEIPDIDLELTFEGIRLADFNEYLHTYARADVEKGAMSIYSELVIDNSRIGGYLKVIIENLQFSDPKEESSFINKVWEGMIAGVTKIFENRKEEQIATEIPFQGQIESTDVGILSAIWAIFRNAFIEAMTKGLDRSIIFPDSARNADVKGKEREQKKDN